MEIGSVRRNSVGFLKCWEFVKIDPCMRYVGITVYIIKIAKTKKTYYYKCLK